MSKTDVWGAEVWGDKQQYFMGEYQFTWAFFAFDKKLIQEYSYKEASRSAVFAI